MWDGQKINVESRIANAVVEALKQRGHDINVIGDFTWETGGMQAVSIDFDSGALTGAADPRRDSYAVAP